MENGRTPNEPQEPRAQENEDVSGPAENIDERGKSRRREQGERPKWSRTAGYIIAIIINVIVLFVANNLLNWNVPFITREFVVPLTILNISIPATILANLIFLFYDPDWFLALARTVLNIIGVVFSYILYVTFPFDFSSLASARLVTIIVTILILLGIVGSVIGVVVEFSKFIRAILQR